MCKGTSYEVEHEADVRSPGNYVRPRNSWAYSSGLHAAECEHVYRRILPDSRHSRIPERPTMRCSPLHGDGAWRDHRYRVNTIQRWDYNAEDFATGPARERDECHGTDVSPGDPRRVRERRPGSAGAAESLRNGRVTFVRAQGAACSPSRTRRSPPMPDWWRSPVTCGVMPWWTPVLAGVVVEHYAYRGSRGQTPALATAKPIETTWRSSR